MKKILLVLTVCTLFTFGSAKTANASCDGVSITVCSSQLDDVKRDIKANCKEGDEIEVKVIVCDGDVDV